ncbi:hypothetical protein [Mammaliicoccus lentus]|uniref:hypothetical protein n=1 Tax=Mammaliicoccus lentus TaxID=42858 RepID=UPI0010725288|nr:hypothetical protein [Mammaliicoccus lentus]MBF0793369.1 hypothetical protein [Mammaliicoccus lentus]TFV17870.1 hypothetical protein E4T78_01800 [Mammaliicoccus lentus]
MENTYIITTVNKKKYRHTSKLKSLPYVYREITENDYIVVKNNDYFKEVLLDTRHIVSIERI